MKTYQPKRFKHLLVHESSKKRFDKKLKVFQSNNLDRKVTKTDYFDLLMDLDG